MAPPKVRLPLFFPLVPKNARPARVDPSRFTTIIRPVLRAQNPSYKLVVSVFSSE
jgi:hypothetical protein